ncbi:MAG: hypothetical protein J6C37_00050 [Roseburia sp.]|nr:hypothetical protein [Roseburia sp.]
MKKIYLKLAASAMSIMVALTMIVGASYAWLTLSQSPTVNGIQVAISGGKTILLAADLTKTVTDANGNEVTVHYPGEFSNYLNISKYESYDYLKKLSGLSPVSTADGLYWLIPVYDEDTAALKDFCEFAVDGTLQYANVTENAGGNYIYLDFWVVSPGTEYNLRVSTDTKTNEGSFLIELPGVEEIEDGFRLADTEGIVASSARIGFLVNADTAGTETMAAYAASENYNTQYKSVLGVYQEKGQTATREYQFVIYEPNATSHPSATLTDGNYIITKPLCYNPYGDYISEEDVSSRLMVQEASTWKAMGEDLAMNQILQTAIVNKQELTAEKAEAALYTELLQGQVAAYVKSGNFYKNTADLYGAASGTTVSAASENLETAGATDDVVITTLKANTPQRIRMYIWLEGQDADCTNSESVSASSFALGLELSGADQ